MARNRSTDVFGRPFGDRLKEPVWRRGQVVNGLNPTIWRNDKCGNRIKFSEYGNINSEYGWEIDHVIPVAKKGSDILSNMQPLQWENNHKKGDTYPWSCS